MCCCRYGRQSPCHGEVVTRTYSLAEVAAVYLPPEWKDGVRWLSRRLNRGEIQGYKVGRVWRMTEGDVAAFVESRRNPTKPAAGFAAAASAKPGGSVIDGLSERSRRRVTECETGSN